MVDRKNSVQKFMVDHKNLVFLKKILRDDLPIYSKRMFKSLGKKQESNADLWSQTGRKNNTGEKHSGRIGSEGFVYFSRF